MTEEKRIGTIYAVTSSKVLATVDDQLTDTFTRTINGETYRVGQIGSYVLMPEGNRQIVGVINEIKKGVTANGQEAEASSVDLQTKTVIDIQLLGTMREGRFERGVSVYPAVNGPVYMTERDDLDIIFSTYRHYQFSVGELSMFEGERLYLDPNRFFGKHIALMGSTGSGKSSAVASLLQKVQTQDNTHIIILDMHDEYRNAFRENGNCIKITELELPYWLMNFEELQETFVDENEASAHNQVMVMKEAILDSKKNKNPTLRDLLTVDTPVYFDLMDVRVRMQGLDAERIYSGGRDREGPFYGQFTRFLVRMDSKLNDKRYEFIFKPKTYKTSETLKTLLTKIFGLDTEKKVTVLDLSGVPFDVVNVIVSLLGRTIYDFNFWNKDRRDFPVLIVFEEAHNYLPSVATASTRSAKKTVERIAKEGRKYGVSSMIVSQRPSEVSETILSQCNNFVTMRLINPNDQEYVKKLVPESLSNLIDILPTLRQGEAFFLGDAVALPARVLIDFPNPEPDNQDIKFYEKWTKRENKTNVPDVIERWWKQDRSS